MTTLKKILLLLFLLSNVFICAGATGIYVAVTGNDSGAGTLESPFRTIQKAAVSAQAGDTVWIRAGIYRETVTPIRDGSADQPIVFKAYPEEEVIINGADLLSGWTPTNDSIWEAPMQSS